VPNTSPTTRADFLCSRQTDQLVHPERPVDRLRAIADVGQRAADDDGHGVSNKPHLLSIGTGVCRSGLMDRVRFS
jgi:hypothetical protein